MTPGPFESEGLLLPWNRKKSVALAADKFRLDTTFTDVELICGGYDTDQRGLRAHQAVLSGLSPLLRSLFASYSSCCACNGDKCLTGGSINTVTLLLPGYGQGVVSKMLELIYCGRTELDSQERMELAGLVHSLQLSLPEVVKKALKGPRKRRLPPGQETDQAKKRKVVPNEDGVYECWRCGANYLSERSLFSHSVLCKKLHPDEEEDITEGLAEQESPEEDIERAVVGEEDGRVVFLTATTEEISLEQIVVKDEPLDEDGNVFNVDTCKYCLMPFRSRQSLLRHLCSTHFAKQLEKRYGHLPACPRCGAAFDSTGELVTHVGVEHGAVNRYVDFCVELADDLNCPHCGEAEDSPQGLIDHLARAHYAAKLRELYPARDACPVCNKKMAGRGAIIEHLVGKHFALFKVVPVKVCDQLLRIMSDEMLEERENSRSNAKKACSLAVEFEDLENPNLICPVCEKVFSLEMELKEDLAAHYLDKLGEIFGVNLSCCPFCQGKAGEGDSKILSHIAVSHGQLWRALPEQVRKDLAGSGVHSRRMGPAVTVWSGKQPGEIPPLPREDDGPLIVGSASQSFKEWENQSKEHQQQGGEPPASSPTHPTTTTTRGNVVKCPGCQVAIHRLNFDRHLALVHLNPEIQPFVDLEKHQCKICHLVLSNNRIAKTHVAKMHGFVDGWLEKQKAERPGKGDASKTKPTAPPLTEAASSFGGVPCPLPGCRSPAFHIWSKWKKHIYYHVKDNLSKAFPSVDKSCLECGKSFQQRTETLFHMGMAHNKIFASLPPELTERLRESGLTVDPNKREYCCPLCTDGTTLLGAYTFKVHLFAQHCRPRMRACFLHHGNTCLYCDEVFADVNATVKHLALEHNQFMDFLPQEVHEAIKAMGVFSASKVAKPIVGKAQAAHKPAASLTAPTPLGAAPPSPNPTRTLPISLTSPFGNSSSPSNRPKVALAKEKNAWVTATATKVGDISGRKISPGKSSTLVCPVCQRDQWSSRLYLKRHLLSSHYINAIKMKYGHCNRSCPYCQCVACSHQDNLRHIALAHDKLRSVMPREVIEELVRMGVMADLTEEGGSPAGDKSAPGASLVTGAATATATSKGVLPLVTNGGFDPHEGTPQTAAAPKSLQPAPKTRLKIKPIADLLEAPPSNKDAERPGPPASAGGTVGQQESPAAGRDSSGPASSPKTPIKVRINYGDQAGEAKATLATTIKDKIRMAVRDASKTNKNVVVAKGVAEMGVPRLKIKNIPKLQGLEKLSVKESAVRGEKTSPGTSSDSQQDRVRLVIKAGKIAASEKQGELKGNDAATDIEEKAEDAEGTADGKPEPKASKESVNDAKNGTEDSKKKGGEKADPEDTQRIVDVIKESPLRKKPGRKPNIQCPNCEVQYRDPYDLCCHVVTAHHRAGLLPVLQSFNRICPDCGSKPRSDDRFLVHYFVEHGRRGQEGELSHKELECFTLLEGDRRLKPIAPKVSQPPEESSHPGPTDDAQPTKKSGLKKIEMSRIKWKKSLLDRVGPAVLEDLSLRDTASDCPICGRSMPSARSALSHLCFHHYRCLPHLEEEEAKRVVADASGIDCATHQEDDDVSCPFADCQFVTSSTRHLREHVTAHFYHRLRDKMRAKAAGAGFLCDMGPASQFDSLVHLGWEHGAIREFAPQAVSKKLFEELYSVDVTQCKAAKAGDKLFGRPFVPINSGLPPFKHK